MIDLEGYKNYVIEEKAGNKVVVKDRAPVRVREGQVDRTIAIIPG
jgi:hypothetical protein